MYRIRNHLPAETRLQIYNFYLTLILLRLFQQHYCYNVTGQSQESERSCKPAKIKEVHSKLHSFQASLCTLTATHLTLIYVCTYIRLSVPLGCLIKQAGIIIHTILNMWETPGIEPVTSDLTSVYIKSAALPTELLHHSYIKIWIITPLYGALLQNHIGFVGSKQNSRICAVMAGFLTSNIEMILILALI